MCYVLRTERTTLGSPRFRPLSCAFSAPTRQISRQDRSKKTARACLLFVQFPTPPPAFLEIPNPTDAARSIYNFWSFQYLAPPHALLCNKSANRKNQAASSRTKREEHIKD